MKLLCSVTEASDNGDKLRLKLQGTGIAEHGGAWSAQELTVPMTVTNRRTFHVGRRVTIEIKPTRK